MSARPFRFGVQVAAAEDARAWRDLARRAEDAGYDVLSLPDHLGAQLAPLIALTAAGTVTTRIRLGTWVLANDFRHPALLAREAATLDLLCEGRLELGLGAGWMLEDYASSGIPLDPPARRIERLAEAVAVLRDHWADAPAGFRGRHYQVSTPEQRIRPRQRPGPPIAIGGGGRRVLELAAQRADIVGLGMRLSAGRMGPDGGPTITAEATDRKLAWVHAAAAEKRRDPELNARVYAAHVGPGAKDRAASVATPLGLAAEALRASPHALLGEISEIEEHLRATRERWGIAYFTVSGDALESLAPLVARLTGT